MVRIHSIENFTKPFLLQDFLKYSNTIHERNKIDWSFGIGYS